MIQVIVKEKSSLLYPSGTKEIIKKKFPVSGNFRLDYDTIFNLLFDIYRSRSDIIPPGAKFAISRHNISTLVPVDIYFARNTEEKDPSPLCDPVLGIMNHTWFMAINGHFRGKVEMPNKDEYPEKIRDFWATDDQNKEYAAKNKDKRPATAAEFEADLLKKMDDAYDYFKQENDKILRRVPEHVLPIIADRLNSLTKIQAYEFFEKYKHILPILTR